jgi:hypothetical protein
MSPFVFKPSLIFYEKNVTQRDNKILLRPANAAKLQNQAFKIERKPALITELYRINRERLRFLGNEAEN